MRKLTLIFLTLVSVLVHAQPPDRFYCRYGGSGEDIGYSAKPTFDNQYIIAGSSSSYGTHGGSDVYLIKINNYGFPSWEKFFGGPGNEVGKSVIQLPDSGYMIAGFTDSYGNGGFDSFLLRVDKDGNQLWQKTFGGTDWDFASDLVQASDGNIFIVGNTYSFGSGKKDGFVLKYDLSGNLLTQKFFGGAEDDELRSIIVTNDFQLACVGYTESYEDILGDHFFIKINLNVDTLFTRNFGNTGKSYLNDLIQYKNGDYILVGAETYTNLPFTQSYRVNFNSSATTKVWEGNSFTYDDNESWKSITQSIGGSLRTSTLRDFNKNGFKKQGSFFSNDGEAFYPTIVNEFGGAEDENLYSNEGTKDGGFICTGSTLSYGSVGRDVFFIKLDSNILNYSSVTGIPQQTNYQYKPIVYLEESSLIVVSEASRIPINIEICSLNGSVIMRKENIEEITRFNKDRMENAIYLVRCNYSDLSSFVTKILIH